LTRIWKKVVEAQKKTLKKEENKKLLQNNTPGGPPPVRKKRGRCRHNNLKEAMLMTYSQKKYKNDADDVTTNKRTMLMNSMQIKGRS